MRTTVTIDDDVLAVARALAEQRGSSLGRALSELARRGFTRTDAAADGGDGVPVFQPPADAAPITSEDVYRALSEWP
ncbi:MAG: antitoxin [Gammaproteobacteria bacterium]|nr:antitoxin [Gammaproteobacteria bacterium]